MTEAEELELLELEAQAAGGGSRPDPWAQVSGMGAGPQVVQEQHPDISWKDRLITKNLASSPEAAISYLKKEHPKLDIQTDESGQIKIKRPEEQQYRVLDPEGVDSFKEALKDIGDVGYDVLSGVGSGVATAAAGLGGGLASGGVGAIPAAMAAGAGSSAGLEALRQGLGKYAGMEDNMNLGDIGVAGLAGGVSPLLFGTGASLASASGKDLAGKLAKGLGAKLPEVGSEAAEALLKTQRGVPSRLLGATIEKALPSAASKLSGVSKTDAEDLVKHGDILGKFESNPDAIEELATDTMKNSIDKFRETETALYKQVVNETGADGIDVREALKPWLEKRRELAKAASAEGSTPFQKRAFEEFKNTMDDLWGSPKLNEPSFYTKTPEQFTSIQQRIAELADFDNGLKIKSKVADLSPAEKVIALTSKNSYAGMNKSLSNVSDKIPAIKKNLAEIIQAREFLHKKIGSPEQFVSRMRQAGSDKLEGKMLAAKLKNIGALIGDEGLDQARGIINAADKFGKATPILSQKRIPAAILGAVGGYTANRAVQGQGEGFNLPGVTAGGVLGAALGGPRAMRAILEAARRGGTGSTVAPTIQYGLKPAWNMMLNKENVEK
jgi:hypothetical protein